MVVAKSWSGQAIFWFNAVKGDYIEHMYLAANMLSADPVSLPRTQCIRSSQQRSSGGSAVEPRRFQEERKVSNGRRGREGPVVRAGYEIDLYCRESEQMLDVCCHDVGIKKYYATTQGASLALGLGA